MKNMNKCLCANSLMFQRRLIIACELLQNKVSLLWLVTKDKEQKHNDNQMLDWLHWLFHYT